MQPLIQTGVLEFVDDADHVDDDDDDGDDDVDVDDMFFILYFLLVVGEDCWNIC